MEYHDHDYVDMKNRCEVSTTSNEYLVNVLLLCTECQQPIKARINTQQWIRVEWIGPEGECLGCYQLKAISNNKS